MFYARGKMGDDDTDFAVSGYNNETEKRDDSDADGSFRLSRYREAPDGLKQKGLVQIIENKDGRRLKVTAMAPEELFGLFATKILAIGTFQHLLLKRRQRRHATKLLCMGITAGAVLRRRRRRIGIKSTSLAIFKMLAVNKRRQKLASKLVLAAAPIILKNRQQKSWSKSMSRLKGVARAKMKFKGPRLKAVRWDVLNEAQLEGTVWASNKKVLNTIVSASSASL